MEDNRDFWNTELDRVRREYLDVLLLEVPEPTCPYVSAMSQEEVQNDLSNWMVVLEKVKRNGTIQDIDLFIQLMKQSKALINYFGTFCPIENLFSFFDTGDPEELLGLEEHAVISMKIFQTYLRLGLEEEEEMISNNLEIIMEIISISQNEPVVNYFNEIIENYEDQQANNDLRYMIDR